MPECCLVTEADQNQFLLGIYSLSRVVAERLLREQHVDDVVHDIATDCLIKLRRGRWTHTPLNFEAFVIRMVLNAVINRYRTRVWDAEHDGEHLRVRSVTLPAWMSADRSDDEESFAAFRQRVLSTLPARCQQAYYMVRDEGATYAEAAVQLGVASKTVHNDVVRAQRALRKELRAQGHTVLHSGHGGRPRRNRRRVIEAHFAPEYRAPLTAATALDSNVDQLALELMAVRLEADIARGRL